MNKILIVTTKGCVACDIQFRNVNKAATFLCAHNLIVQRIDFEIVDRNSLSTYEVTDFPTTLYFNNGELIDRQVGSHSTEEIKPIIRKLL